MVNMKTLWAISAKKKKTVLDENKDLGFLELETQGENMKSK
jgi:hypothetical protein